MNHKEKLQLARKMMTQDNIKNHVPPFQTAQWMSRSYFIQKHEHNKGRKND